NSQQSTVETPPSAELVSPPVDCEPSTFDFVGHLTCKRDAHAFRGEPPQAAVRGHSGAVRGETKALEAQEAADLCHPETLRQPAQLRLPDRAERSTFLLGGP